MGSGYAKPPLPPFSILSTAMRTSLIPGGRRPGAGSLSDVMNGTILGPPRLVHLMDEAEEQWNAFRNPP
jgi:hypothetical protein